MAEAILLADQQVLPQRLLAEGFQFQFPDLASALADLYPDSKTQE
jgi:NAD dependent epimerase/dehydratase family enzyme